MNSNCRDSTIHDKLLTDINETLSEACIVLYRYESRLYSNGEIHQHTHF